MLDDLMSQTRSAALFSLYPGFAHDSRWHADFPGYRFAGCLDEQQARTDTCPPPKTRPRRVISGDATSIFLASNSILRAEPTEKTTTRERRGVRPALPLSPGPSG